MVTKRRTIITKRCKTTKNRHVVNMQNNLKDTQFFKRAVNNHTYDTNSLKYICCYKEFLNNHKETHTYYRDTKNNSRLIEIK